MISFRHYLEERFYDYGLTDLSGIDAKKLQFMKSAIKSFNTNGDFAKLEQKISNLLGKSYFKKITPDQYIATSKAKNYLNTDYSRRSIWSAGVGGGGLQIPHDFNSKDIVDVATVLHELGHRMFAHTSLGASVRKGTDEDWLTDEKLASNFALEVLKLAGIDTTFVQQQLEKDYSSYVSTVKSRLACWACGSGNTEDTGGGRRSCQDCYTDY